MRIIVQVAPNTRLALRGIRERLGDNAVILSSRRVPDGVEVTAGADVSEAAVPEAAPAAAPTQTPPISGVAPQTPPEVPLVSAIPRAVSVSVPAPGGSPLAVRTKPATGDAVGEELKSLRCMLETQLAQLAWSDLTRRLPVHAELLRELTELGLARDLAERIAEQLPEGTDLAHARRFAFTALAQYLPVTGERWAEGGGCLAFVGATGVGKTTSLAKIAVRWALRQGARELALVAADSARIGAQDEVRALGQLLGAAVYVPERFEDLPTLLTQLT